MSCHVKPDRLRLCVPKLLGEPDENTFGAPDVAEPIRVFELDYFVDELRRPGGTGHQMLESFVFAKNSDIRSSLRGKVCGVKPASLDIASCHMSIIENGPSYCL